MIRYFEAHFLSDTELVGFSSEEKHYLLIHLSNDLGTKVASRLMTRTSYIDSFKGAVIP